MAMYEGNLLKVPSARNSTSAISPTISPYLTPPLMQPLLGSPFTCGIWEPKKFNTYHEKSKQSDVNYQLLPLALKQRKSSTSIWGDGALNINIDPEILSTINRKFMQLDDLLCDARLLRMEIQFMTSAIEELTTSVELRVQQALAIRLDFTGQLYLEKIISFLNGDLSKLNLENWPFHLCQSANKEDLNLVI